MDITSNTLDRLTSAVLNLSTSFCIIACHKDGSVRRVDSAFFENQMDALVAAREISARLRHRWYAVNVADLLTVLDGSRTETAKDIATK